MYYFNTDYGICIHYLERTCQLRFNDIYEYTL